jgi:hypothetical protein
MIPTLRTMTKKSKLNFGKYRDKTIQQMLDLNRKIELISAYYKLTSINYTEDILSELNIVGDYVIEKPSADRDLYYKFLNENGYKKRLRSRDGADRMKRESRQWSRSMLQRYNQGH